MIREATNNKNLRYTKIAVLGFFLIWLAVALFTCNVHAELAPYPLESECYALSKTDALDGEYKADGSPYTVFDYIKDVKDHTLDTDSDLHTRLIRKIIPSRAFINTGEYFHQGKSYSFYIKTTDKTNKYLYASEVVLVYYGLNMTEERASKATLELAILSNGYYTGVTNGKIITYCNGFAPSGDYYLRDIQFDCWIENVNEPNYGDPDYVKANDTGTVFSETRVSFKGIKEYKESGSYGALARCTIDALFSFVPESEGIKVVYKGLSTFADWCAAIVGSVPVPKKDIVEHNSETYIQDFLNKEEQDNAEKYYRETSVALSDNNILIDNYLNCTIKLFAGKPETRVVFDVSYNMFVHPSSGKDYIFLSNGKTKTYTKSLSNSAQFKQRREYNMFKGR